ncbi:hypothetical protein HDU97_001486 [Phlyctochytrium planicorne]|nr:hypothetical protein HDU97_001486 [Phlyctochytrium planicorne]
MQLPVEVIETILMHLAPSSAYSVSDRCQTYLDLSGIRMLLRFSATSTKLKAIIKGCDRLWMNHWEAIFDPCYDGVVRFPRIDEIPAKLELRTLPVQVYQRRIKERSSALSILAREDLIEKGEVAGYSIKVIADMCAESVSKNRRILGEMIHAETLFKFFEKDFGEFWYGFDSAVEASDAWAIKTDFFQVLAHYSGYGREFYANSLLILRLNTPSRRVWLTVKDGLTIHFNPNHASSSHLMFLNTLINIRQSHPNFLPPPPIPIPELLSSANWRQKYFTGSFGGTRRIFSEGEHSTKLDLLTFDATSLKDPHTPIALLRGAFHLEEQAWSRFRGFDTSRGMLIARQGFLPSESESRLHVSEFGLVGVQSFTMLDWYVLYWKERTNELEWPWMERTQKDFVEEAKANWEPSLLEARKKES